MVRLVSQLSVAVIVPRFTFVAEQLPSSAGWLVISAAHAVITGFTLSVTVTLTFFETEFPAPSVTV